MERETVRRLEQALDGALADIREASSPERRGISNELA